MFRKLLLVRDFFPFRLVFAHIKYNFFSLFTWLLLALFIAERLGTDFGVPFLFYSPEYLGEVSHWSFAILGFSVGGLTMAFNTYSYSKLGPRFPFLVVVSAPFFRFCLNNALIPLSYITYYLYRMSIFQASEELASTSTIAGYNFAYIGGFISFILLSFAYFFPIRKNKDLNDDADDSTDSLIKSFTNKGEKWYNYFRADSRRPIYYIGKRFKIYRSRSVAHLDTDLIDQIYASGRINAFGFEALTLATFLGIGFFREYPMFELPAAVSIVLVFTILSMLFSAIFSWFHRWTYPIIFGTIGLMTYLSTTTPFFRYTSYALGLDYTTENRTPYTVENIAKNGHIKGDSTASHRNIKSILTSWKEKQTEKKPKLIILNTSGGGSRSALWTVVVLGNCDSLTKGEVSNHLHLISGASGGMVGAAYYREIMLRRALGKLENGSNQEYKNRIAKDLLNKLSFSASTSDLLMRYKKILYNNRYYTFERGAAFEAQLHENLNQFLEHPIGYYEEYERNAITPLMIFSPTIINDGRRLLISSQNLSFMVRLRGNTSTYENIDYQTFFKNNDPQNLRFSSAIRASATFPFIMPMMTMPTTPEIQLMDAGIRDNYGGKVTIDYLFANSDWIAKNTSGVIILETRDTKRVLNDETYHEINLLDKITMPFGNIIINFTRTQDFDQEQLMRLVTKSFDFPVDIVTFNLREQTKDRVSLSWRLTEREKKRIEKAFESQENTEALFKLKKLLGLNID